MNNNVTFRVNSDADSCGTSLQGYIEGNYQKMVELFGEPIESDGYKVSSEWIFESETGDVVTVYDWKSTNLYDEDLPSIEEFRRFSQCTFHLGSNSSTVVNQFKIWFMNQLTFKIEG
jgi:hypothetical protein